MSVQSIKLVAEIKNDINNNDINSHKDGQEKYLIKDFTHKLSPRIMAMLLETIMGVGEGDLDPNFMSVAEKFDSVMCSRITTPWKIVTPLYALSNEGQEIMNALKFSRNETKRIIAKRIKNVNENSSKNLENSSKNFENSKNGSKNAESIKNCKNLEPKDDENSIKSQGSYIKTNQGSINNNKKERKPTLIDCLIDEHKLDPIKMPVDDIIDEVINFLFAGWDTTTWATSIILQLIGNHDDVQDKIYKEIVHVFGVPCQVNNNQNDDQNNSNQNFENPKDEKYDPKDIKIDNISMQDAQKLKYMEAVIYESLRLYPLVNIHGRRLTTELTTEIDGEKVTFPPWTEVIIDSELVHRNERYFKDANRFHPERFLSRCPSDVEPDLTDDNDWHQDIEPFSFIPFSAGARNCIGKVYGCLEIKIILTHILTNFKVKSVQPMDRIKFNYVGTVRRTDEPLQFMFEPRD